MMGENKIINDFNEYSIWINTLKGMKEELWMAPISGKMDYWRNNISYYELG